MVLTLSSGLSTPPRRATAAHPHGVVVTNLYHQFESDSVAGTKIQNNLSEEEDQNRPYLYFVNYQGTSVSLAETPKFEVAYCHYRKNNHHKTLNVLDTVTQPVLKHNELRPQVLYKLKKSEKCSSVCRDIMRPGQSFGSQKNVNVPSVTAHLGDSARTMDTSRESYEKTYNTGCNYHNVGDLTSTEKAAREDKVGIIKVQCGYVTNCQGSDKDAQNIYNQMLRNKRIDIGLTAAVSVHMIAINQDQKTRIQDLLSSSFFLHLGQLSLGLLTLGAGVLEAS